MNNYLTKEEYFSFVEQHKNESHLWNTAKVRWNYYYWTIEWLKHFPYVKKILEAGTMGINVYKNSDTIDLHMPKEGWPLVYVPTYNHDLRIIPWPIKDKQYNIFIALRVFHHMIDKAEECFNEMCRISDFIILVLPEWGAKVYREIRKPSHEITNLGYIWDDQTAILFYDVCTYKIYSKIKIIDGLIYKKIIGNSAKELIEREIYWLKKLESYDITPKVIKFFDDTVVMTYCGEPLNAEQLKSPDIQNQILKIIGILLENECFYTDLTYHNFLILNGKVRIIDFEWCSLVKEDFTCDGAINSKIIKRPLGRNFDLFKII